MKPLTPKMREALERLAQECKGKQLWKYERRPENASVMNALVRRGLIDAYWYRPLTGPLLFVVSVLPAGRKALESEDA